jgi:uncharacterized protein YraI
MSIAHLSARKIALMVAGAAAIGLTAPSIGLAQEFVQTTSDLNLRAGPGTDQPVITTMPAGAEVELVQCPDPGAWCELNYAGTTGWASANFLTVDPMPTGVIEEPPAAAPVEPQPAPAPAPSDY